MTDVKKDSEILWRRSSSRVTDIVSSKDLLSELSALTERYVGLYNSNSRNKQIRSINSAYKSESLVLVLGAGVSTSLGIPAWNSLLQNLLTYKLKDKSNHSGVDVSVLADLLMEVFPSNPLISARYLNNNNTDFSKPEDYVEFIMRVREVLYENISPKQDSPLISEIIQYCIAPGRSPNLNCIITYNYDDVIETELSILDIGVPYKTVFRPGDRASNNELPIYHVHGFIPRSGDLNKDHKIILSEDEYHKRYSDVYNWSNITQINKFRDNSCLFIGISLNDPNMRRLLDIAKTQSGSEGRKHYIFKLKYQNDQIKSRILKLVNTKDKAHQDDIDKITEIIIKTITDYETSDNLSLGVETLWIDNYDEIPQILRQIRHPSK